ncbi:MAG: FHA domain-containing protein, partial [Bradymonadaceae bacterium]
MENAVAEVTIGRSESNDIILSSKTVSRRHAVVKIMGDRVLLVNQSANGVLINGERIDRVSELDYGQFARIEPYQICVEQTEDAPADGAQVADDFGANAGGGVDADNRSTQRVPSQDPSMRNNDGGREANPPDSGGERQIRNRSQSGGGPAGSRAPGNDGQRGHQPTNGAQQGGGRG